MSGVLRHRLKGPRHHDLNLFIVNPSRSSTAWFVEQPSEAALDVPSSPFADRVSSDAKLGGDHVVAKTISTAQNDSGALGETITALRAPAPADELGAVFIGQQERDLWTSGLHEVNLIVELNGNPTIIPRTSVPGH
jgi:hypothetical protein